MIVVDASLAAKLVIAEADSAAADHWFLTAKDEVCAPDLIAIEVAQAIVRRVNSRVMPRDAGAAALHEWSAILAGAAIRLIRTSPTQVAVAAGLAIELGHPVKDCVYLALAIELGGDLATCDARFAAKARRVHPPVRLLADDAAP